MLWEAWQQTQIESAKNAADSAKSKVDRYAADIADTRRQVARLSLACQAMWELLRDHTHLTEDDLDKKIYEIDARDGKVDGKISTQVFSCPSCGKPTHSKRRDCVICGSPIHKQHKFEA